MINQLDIETKDFSLSLPNATDKIKGISSLMISAGFAENNCLEEDGLKGIGNILWEVAEDLETINKALYSSDKRLKEVD